MTRAELKSSECTDYFHRYINQVPEQTELRAGFRNGHLSVSEFFSRIPEDKYQDRYSEDKWSIGEVLQHLIDTERIFIYRVFRIARRDKAPLASFDQTDYVPNSAASKKSKGELLKEFSAVRDSSISLVESLSDEDFSAIGTASDNSMSARAAAFIILGHEVWHMDIIKSKYLGRG